MKELQHIKPSTVEKVLNFVEECAKVLSGYKYRQLVGACERALDVEAVALVDPLLLASVDMNLTDPGTNVWTRDPLYDALEKLVPPR